MRDLKTWLAVGVLTTVWLTSARAQDRPAFYGYGPTADRAAAQCRAQGGLSSTDTTRAADGGVQMRCQRLPASTCPAPNVDTLRADRAASSGPQGRVYEFVTPSVNRVHPDVTLLWGLTRNEGPTGELRMQRTDVYLCDAGRWKFTYSFGIGR